MTDIRKATPVGALGTSRRRRIFLENMTLYSMLLPLLVLILIFCYVPMYGVVIAFQNYIPGNAFLAFDGSVQWVGLAHIHKFIGSIYFTRLLRNTLILSGLNLAFGFWFPVFFALLMNEVRCMPYKKFVQTASYLPHFISSVVIAGLVISFVGKGGIINQLMGAFGAKNRNLLLNGQLFPLIYTCTNVWAGFGFGSILYFSTISSIDPSYYESAKIDGANRLQQLWHITLPGLQSVLAIRLILTLGGVLSSNTDLILLLYNSSIYEQADVIGTYIYRIGILDGQFSYTAAVGIFMSLIGFLLTFLANKASNRFTGYGLW